MVDGSGVRLAHCGGPRLRPVRRALCRRRVTAPKVPGRSGKAPQVLDHGLDLGVVQDEAEGRHPRLADARAAVPNEVGEVAVG